MSHTRPCVHNRLFGFWDPIINAARMRGTSDRTGPSAYRVKSLTTGRRLVGARERTRIILSLFFSFWFSSVLFASLNGQSSTANIGYISRQPSRLRTLRNKHTIKSHIRVVNMRKSFVVSHFPGNKTLGSTFGSLFCRFSLRIKRTEGKRDERVESS